MLAEVLSPRAWLENCDKRTQIGALIALGLLLVYNLLSSAFAGTLYLTSPWQLYMMQTFAFGYGIAYIIERIFMTRITSLLALATGLTFIVWRIKTIPPFP